MNMMIAVSTGVAALAAPPADSPDIELLRLERKIHDLRQRGDAMLAEMETLRGDKAAWLAADGRAAEWCDRERETIERLMAEPSRTPEGRAAKVRAWLDFASSGDLCEGLARIATDWEFDVLRKLLAEMSGMTELTIAKLALRKLDDWPGMQASAALIRAEG